MPTKTRKPAKPVASGPESIEQLAAKVLVFRNGGGEPIAVPDDVVTAAERAYRCHKMRIGGASWDAIALEEKYPNAAAAAHDVKRYLAEGASLVVEKSAREMLTLEVMRMDALQNALWRQAMSGHVPSVTACLSIIVNRARLIGLDPEKMNETAAVTVVVPVEGSAYMAALQSAAGSTRISVAQPEEPTKETP